MKFQVKRESFLKAITTADKAVPSRTTKDIVRNVKLIATTNAITLIATDTEIGLRVQVSDVVASDGGECLLPTSRVIQVLSEFQDERVSFEVESGALWIRGGGRGAVAEFRLSTEDPDGFPDVATFTHERFFKVKATDLRRMIKRTVFACDTESTRYALGGIQVEFNIDKTLIFAATDSRRLAIDQTVFEAVGSPEAPLTAPVVPSKAMKLIASSIEETGDVQIAFNKNGIAVRSGLVTITSQLVQGRFPDWRKVMPGPARQSIDFVVGPFLAAMRQILIMKSEESRAAEFDFSKGTLAIASYKGQVEPKKKKEKTLLADGESKISIPISYDGEPIAINFDAVYVADCLKVLEVASEVQFRLISLEDPGLLVAGDYKYIVMPVSRDS